MVSTQQLIQLIEAEDAHGGPWSEEAFARLTELVAALRPQSPVKAPIDAPAKIQGRWETLFAHFGARHSAGKPKVHDSNLKVQSFNRFPPSPIRVLRLCQEIDPATRAYNNVLDFSAGGSDGVPLVHGVLVVHGRYRDVADNRERFDVEFHCTELRAAPGVTEAALRSAIAFGPDDPLSVELKPPKLHSDVIYLDDELRINAGGLGGLYVLRRSTEPTVSC